MCGVCYSRTLQLEYSPMHCEPVLIGRTIDAIGASMGRAEDAWNQLAAPRHVYFDMSGISQAAANLINEGSRNIVSSKQAPAFDPSVLSRFVRALNASVEPLEHSALFASLPFRLKAALIGPIYEAQTAAQQLPKIIAECHMKPAHVGHVGVTKGTGTGLSGSQMKVLRSELSDWSITLYRAGSVSPFAEFL